MTPELQAGHPVLDFANHRKHLVAPEPGAGYERLLALAREAGVISEHGAARLRRAARERPEEAAGVAERAIALACALWSVIHAHLDDDPPPRAALATLNEAAAEARAHCRVVVNEEGGYGWRWERGTDLGRALWPFAREAAELLVSGDLGRIGCCCSDSCQWLFYDASRNRSRRWCDMSTCGNRAKVRRFRRRATGD